MSSGVITEIFEHIAEIETACDRANTNGYSLMSAMDIEVLRRIKNELGMISDACPPCEGLISLIYIRSLLMALKERIKGNEKNRFHQLH